MWTLLTSMLFCFASSVLCNYDSKLLMYMESGSKADFWRLWNNSGIQSGNVTRLEDIIMDENINIFRSEDIDNWSQRAPTRISLGFVNKRAELLAWVDFRSEFSTYNNWMKPVNILGSSHDITSNNVVFHFHFTDFQILITAEQDESRYWFGIWNGPVSSQAGNSVPYPQFIFSMNSSSSHLFPRDHSQIIPGWESKGCWPGDSVQNHNYFENKMMTLEICRDHCSVEKYFLIEMQYKCWCAQTVDLTTNKKNDNYCYSECRGDTSQICGGIDSNWFSVYEITMPDLSTYTELPVPMTYHLWQIINSYGRSQEKVDLAELNHFLEDKVYVSAVSVFNLKTPGPYNLYYSSTSCNDGERQPYLDWRTSRQEFPNDGQIVEVGVLPARCLWFDFNFPSTTDSTIKIYTPNGTDFMLASSLAVFGFWPIDETTTSALTTKLDDTTIMETTTALPTTLDDTTIMETTTALPTTLDDTTIMETTTATEMPTTPDDTTIMEATPTIQQTTNVDDTTIMETTITNLKKSNSGWTALQNTDVQVTTTDDGHSSTNVKKETKKITETTDATTKESAQYCDCKCKVVSKMTFEDLPVKIQEEIVEMKKNLTVPKKSLSSYIRAKTSAPDDRPSAQRIGSFGIAMLTASIFTIILMDIDRIMVVLCMIREKIN